MRNCCLCYSEIIPSPVLQHYFGFGVGDNVFGFLLNLFPLRSVIMALDLSWLSTNRCIYSGQKCGTSTMLGSVVLQYTCTVVHSPVSVHLHCVKFVYTLWYNDFETMKVPLSMSPYKFSEPYDMPLLGFSNGGNKKRKKRKISKRVAYGCQTPSAQRCSDQLL